MNLCKLWVLKVGLPVIDTIGDRHWFLTTTKLCQREVKMISLVNYELLYLTGENVLQLETKDIQVFTVLNGP
jgi:hypothetical protein